MLDDGAGFGGAASGGTGVGLTNMRRQLAARYGSSAQLRLDAREPRGARAAHRFRCRRAAGRRACSRSGDGRWSRADDGRGAATAAPLAAGRIAGSAGFVAGCGRTAGAVVMAGLLGFAAPVTFFAGSLSVVRAVGAGGAALAFSAVAGCVSDRASWSPATAPAAAAAARERRRLGWRSPACAARLRERCPPSPAAPSARAGVGDARDCAVLDRLLVHAGAAVLRAPAAQPRRRSRRGAWPRPRRRSARRAGASCTRTCRRCRRASTRLLFDMLDAVRLAYAIEPARAERLLDELVAFLRAALPRLRDASSSVAREVELARALRAAARWRRVSGVELASTCGGRCDARALSAGRAAALVRRRAAGPRRPLHAAGGVRRRRLP